MFYFYYFVVIIHIFFIIVVGKHLIYFPLYIFNAFKTIQPVRINVHPKHNKEDLYRWKKLRNNKLCNVFITNVYIMINLFFVNVDNVDN